MRIKVSKNDNVYYKFFLPGTLFSESSRKMPKNLDVIKLYHDFFVTLRIRIFEPMKHHVSNY